MAENDKKETKAKSSFFKKYGSTIHISIVALVICAIMIYITVNGG